MRAPQRLLLVFLSAVLAGLVCVPPAYTSKHSARQSRRSHRALSQRQGRALRFVCQALRAERDGLSLKGAAPRGDAGRDQLAALPAAAPSSCPPPPLACGQVLGEPAQEFISPPLWVLFRRLLI
jgi:hypothetical protein